MDSTYLVLKDGSKLQWLEKDYSYYFRKMTLIFGGSGTGKTTVMDEIMWLLKPHIPTCFVISPTNNSNQAFTGKVPKKFIQDGRDMDKLVKWLERFIERQKNAAQMYMHANNIQNLKELFDKVSDSQSTTIERSIIEVAENKLISIENADDLNFAEKKTQALSIKVERDNVLRKLYKTTLRYNKVALETSARLTKHERVTLSFLDINPHVLLIMDDCASKFKKLYKMTTAIKEIFYEGRQYFITTIITTQDDKEIDSELRKNSMINIFTTAQTATAAFERSSNSYPKHVKDRSKYCIEAIFKQEPGKPQHYQKLVYIQNLTDPFRYTIADLYDEFRMCSDSIWEFENRLSSKDKDDSLENNPFFTKYS